MSLIDYLDASLATEAFREAVRSVVATGRANGHISFPPHTPRVKIQRTLTQLLKKYPILPIESVRIDGRSGCEYFRGELVIRTAAEERRVQFDWDCRWKALQLGWIDYFGQPDQIRAAREFDFDCFKSWRDAA